MGPATTTISIPPEASFFNASYWFNASSFLIGLTGLLITTGGFWLTIQQVRQAKREATRAGDAAEAAKQAATEAKQQVSSIAAVVDVAALVNLAQEVLNHIGHEDYAAAELRSHDLRAGIARFRRSAVGRSSLADESWQEMVAFVALVYERMFALRYGSAVDIDVVKGCHRIIADIHERLSGLVPEAAHRAIGS